MSEIEELRYLCTEVYHRKPDWTIQPYMHHFDENGDIQYRNYMKGISFHDKCVPLYTCEFIDTKLPMYELNKYDHNYYVIWTFPSASKQNVKCEATGHSGLEARLALVLELIKAGEL
jgi:hypothetical protein